MKPLLLLIAFWLAAPGPTFADEDVTRMPGYVDLSQFLHKEKELTTEVEITNPLLSLVAMAAGAEDAELAKVLNLLKLIKVYSFNIKPEEVSSLASQIQAADDKMTKAHWNPFVKVREGKEVTHVYMKVDKQRVVGLAIFSVDQNQASFVNIVGEIDMQSMNKLGEKFNIPKMDSVKMQVSK